MRLIICDKCGKEIKTDVVKVLNYELCPECAEVVNDFIQCSMRTSIMDDLRDFCAIFKKNCLKCPFYNEDLKECELSDIPSKWTSGEEIFGKLLEYKVKHIDWREGGK